MKKLVRLSFAMLLLLIFLLLPFASAAETLIKVKTMPRHSIQLAIIKSTDSSSELVETLKGDADQYGDLQFTLSNGLSEFYINAFVYSEGEKVYKKNFIDPFETGGEISITLVPEGFMPIETPGATPVVEPETVTETPVETPTEETSALVIQDSPSTETETIPAETEATQDSSAVPLTGNAVSKALDSTMPFSYLYYLLGALLLAGILFFVFKNRGGSATFNNNHFKPASKHDAHYVMHLEKKLKGAEQEIHALKNHEKIKEIEKRMEEEKKEIERLKHGY